MCREPADEKVISGIRLWKMIYATVFLIGGEAIMTFMGNEFGHPEWIEFPTRYNDYSYKNCRRLWHLGSDTNLYYNDLLNFSVKLNNFLISESESLFSSFPVIEACQSTSFTVLRGDHRITANFAALTFEVNSISFID